MNYSESVDFLLSLPDMERASRGPLARTMSLDAMRSLLSHLGDPQKGRKTVHVTGSKGKGSTSAMIASVLDLIQPTMIYTSPHLHSYLERICVGLQSISESDFSAALSAIREKILEEHHSELGPISTFGAMTALFFELCSRHQAQWQVVEVGMGGLYDASNVFENTDLVVITAISLEHTNILGASIEEIARNKAGIIKSGSSVILASQSDPSVSPLIREICLERGAKLIDVATEYQLISESHDQNGQYFELRKDGKLRQFHLKMLGEHQIQNAITAVAAADEINARGVHVEEATLCRALERVCVPGRLELLQEAPPVVIDGAHNGDSARALVKAVSRHFSSEKCIYVLGVNSDKDISSMIEAFRASAKLIIATRSASDKAMSPEQIAELSQQAGIPTEISSSCEEAIEIALRYAGAPKSEVAANKELICITGSLYLIAEAREFLAASNLRWSLGENLAPDVRGAAELTVTRQAQG